MKKSLLGKFILILCVVFALMFSINITCQASQFIDTSTYAPGSPAVSDSQAIVNKAKPIIRALRNISIITAVLVISVLGVQYILASPNEKASYKEKMMPIIIGCFMVAGLGTILSTILYVTNLG